MYKAMIIIDDMGFWFSEDEPHIIVKLKRIPLKYEILDLSDKLEEKLISAINKYNVGRSNTIVDSICDYHWVGQVGYRIDKDLYCITLHDNPDLI